VLESEYKAITTAHDVTVLVHLRGTVGNGTANGSSVAPSFTVTCMLYRVRRCNYNPLQFGQQRFGIVPKSGHRKISYECAMLYPVVAQQDSI
jgi:hypothetical protein